MSVFSLAIRISETTIKGQDKAPSRHYAFHMGIIENMNWSKSALGKPIPLFQSHEKLERPILFMGGVHGDEPEGVALAEGLLKWLKEDTLGAKKAKAPWAVIPCLNPDGFILRERTNGNKVDLNRNYPSSDWSPGHKAPRYYPGPKPASENEIQQLCTWIQANRPRLIIHFHSWKPCVVYAGDPAFRAADLLGQVSGYKVDDDIGYPTPGSLSQYGWIDNKIPVICIEEQDPTPRNLVWGRFAEGLVKIVCEPERVGLG